MNVASAAICLLVQCTHVVVVAVQTKQARDSLGLGLLLLPVAAASNSPNKSVIQSRDSPANQAI